MALLDLIRDAVKGALSDTTSAPRIKELDGLLAAALSAHDVTKTALATAEATILTLTAAATAATKVITTDSPELIKANADLAAQITALTTDKTTLASEVATLKATIADPKGKIEQVAGHKAAEIAGAQGVPAIPAQPAANPKTETPAAIGLKGRARFAAATKAQLDKDFPLARGN